MMKWWRENGKLRKPPGRAAFVRNTKSVCYLRRRRTSIAARPRPASANVLGSGTNTGASVKFAGKVAVRLIGAPGGVASGLPVAVVRMGVAFRKLAVSFARAAVIAASNVVKFPVQTWGSCLQT
jgi:hypothetical protein